MFDAEPQKRSEFCYGVLHVIGSVALSRFLRHRSFESLLVLKVTRNALGQDSMLLRYFEMFDQDKLDWNEGNNLVVYHLKSLAEQHDNLLGHDRQPCGTVKDVVKDAIPAWNNYEKQKGWIDDVKTKDTSACPCATSSSRCSPVMACV